MARFRKVDKRKLRQKKKNIIRVQTATKMIRYNIICRSIIYTNGDSYDSIHLIFQYG